VRDAALVKLEEERKEKRIGKGLEAELEIAASGEQLALLQRHAAGLKEIVNVSRVTVVKGPELSIRALPASGTQVRPLLELHAGGRATTVPGRTSAPAARRR
jgi:isoleucyl-tRNA synthetase